MEIDLNNILKYLLPIVFLTIWTLAKLFASKKTEEPQIEKDLNEKIFEPEEHYEFQDEAVNTYIDQQSNKIVPPVDSKREVLSHPHSLLEIQFAQQKRLKNRPKSFELNELTDSKSLKTVRKKSEILDLLNSSQALRKTFLTYEILGPPLSLRKNGKIGRSWQR